MNLASQEYKQLKSWENIFPILYYNMKQLQVIAARAPYWCAVEYLMRRWIFNAPLDSGTWRHPAAAPGTGARAA